jgi:cytochrome c peroxidase
MKKWFVLSGLFATLFVVLAFTTPKFEEGSKVAFHRPSNFPQPVYDVKSFPVSEDGFKLGRTLFYDALLSRDNTISCGSCHNQAAAFTHHGHDLSHGIDDQLGKRNAPPIQNLAWSTSFMWDGGIHNLDMQPISPIENPVEMDEQLSNVLLKLKASPKYPALFQKAFGTADISSVRMLQAMSQFMVMMVSANSKYDSVMRKEGAVFTTQEEEGYVLFKKTCSSCHTEPLFTDQSFRNNGIGIGSENDFGRFEISALEKDKFTFKVPSLRNVDITAPYMHDGRMRTLDEVLDHYTDSVQDMPNLDPFFKIIPGKIGLALTTKEKQALKAFLQTLTDNTFIRNPIFEEQ